MRIFIVPFFILLIMLSGCSPTDSSSELVFSEDNNMGTAEDSEQDGLEDNGSAGQSAPEDVAPADVVVYVCGAVNDPGVYDLPSDSRAGDAVDAAGGFSEDADENYVNLAAVISDGTKLFIPTTEQVGSIGVNAGFSPDTYDQSAVSVDNSSDRGLININTASAQELKTLPGVGDAIADRIVNYRQDNGNFKSIEDIMKVSGIKDKLFSKIKDKITTS